MAALHTKRRAPNRWLKRKTPHHSRKGSRWVRSTSIPPQIREQEPGPLGFESEAAAIREDQYRIKSMRRAIPKPGLTYWINWGDQHWLRNQYDCRKPQIDIDVEAAKLLIQKLEDGIDSGFPSHTLASSLTMRGIRQTVIGAVFRAFEVYDDADLRMFTISNRGWVFTPEQLDDVTAAKIKAQLVSHLKRAGISSLDGPLLAFLHGEFDPVSRTYNLHFHGVTTQEKAKALGQLVGRWGYLPTLTKAAPIRCPKVGDRRRQFTYLLKSFWPSKGVREVGSGRFKRDRKGGRIPERFHSQYLLWLDRQALKEMTVFNGGWSHRNGGPPAMKALYLSIFGR